MMPLAMIRSDPQYQPRSARLVRLGDRPRLEEQSAEHIGRMAGVLASSIRAQLEPLLVAEVDGARFVIDGHHRLEAYRRAKRAAVPGKVMAMPARQAALVSKLVNCDARALPMHAEQAREAAWQYLAEVTHRGTLRLPKGISTRSIEATFGVGHDTAGRMLRKLPEVNPAEYGGEACDPATGWPCWRYVRSHGWRGMADALPADKRLDRDTGKVQRAILKALERYGMDAFSRGIQGLLRDAQGAAGDPEALRALDQWAALEEGPPAF